MDKFPFYLVCQRCGLYVGGGARDTAKGADGSLTIDLQHKCDGRLDDYGDLIPVRDPVDIKAWVVVRER